MKHFVDVIDNVKTEVKKIIWSFILPCLWAKPASIPMILKRIYTLSGITLSYSIKHLSVIMHFRIALLKVELKRTFGVGFKKPKRKLTLYVAVTLAVLHNFLWEKEDF